MQSSSPTDVARSHGGAGAKAGGGNFIEEDAAEVDLQDADDEGQGCRKILFNSRSW